MYIHIFTYIYIGIMLPVTRAPGLNDVGMVAWLAVIKVILHIYINIYMYIYVYLYVHIYFPI
jgi:hypothetical protein